MVKKTDADDLNDQVEAPADQPIAQPRADAAPVSGDDVVTVPNNTPQAERVETFQTGESWGYRSVAADGTVVRETALDYTSQADALRDAKRDSNNEDLRIMDEEIGGNNRFAW